MRIRPHIHAPLMESLESREFLSATHPTLPRAVDPRLARRATPPPQIVGVPSAHTPAGPAVHQPVPPNVIVSAPYKGQPIDFHNSTHTGGSLASISFTAGQGTLSPLGGLRMAGGGNVSPSGPFVFSLQGPLTGRLTIPPGVSVVFSGTTISMKPGSSAPIQLADLGSYINTQHPSTLVLSDVNGDGIVDAHDFPAPDAGAVQLGNTTVSASGSLTGGSRAAGWFNNGTLSDPWHGLTLPWHAL